MPYHRPGYDRYTGATYTCQQPRYIGREKKRNKERKSTRENKKKGKTDKKGQNKKTLRATHIPKNMAFGKTKEGKTKYSVPLRRSDRQQSKKKQKSKKKSNKPEQMK